MQNSLLVWCKIQIGTCGREPEQGDTLIWQFNLEFVCPTNFLNLAFVSENFQNLVYEYIRIQFFKNIFIQNYNATLCNYIAYIPTMTYVSVFDFMKLLYLQLQVHVDALIGVMNNVTQLTYIGPWVSILHDVFIDGYSFLLRQYRLSFLVFT